MHSMKTQREGSKVFFMKCRAYREHPQNIQLLQLPCTSLSNTNPVHTEEYPAVLLHAGNENFKQLFYTIVCSVLMGQ